MDVAAIGAETPMLAIPFAAITAGFATPITAFVAVPTAGLVALFNVLASCNAPLFIVLKALLLTAFAALVNPPIFCKKP